MSPHSQFSTIHGPSRHWNRTLLPKCSPYSGKTQMTLWPLHVPSLHTLPLGRPQDEATGHLCNCSVTPKSHPPSRRSRSSLPDFWKRVNFGCPFPRAGLAVLRSLFAPPLPPLPPRHHLLSSPLSPPTCAAVCCHCTARGSLLQFSSSALLSASPEQFI